MPVLGSIPNGKTGQKIGEVRSMSASFGVEEI